MTRMLRTKNSKAWAMLDLIRAAGRQGNRLEQYCCPRHEMTLSQVVLPNGFEYWCPVMDCGIKVKYESGVFWKFISTSPV